MLSLGPLGTSLPREARDTLFVLGVIAGLALLQAPYVPWWCSALSLAVLAGRAWLALQSRPLPGMPWRLGLLALALLATAWSHQTLLGRDAGVTLIVVLLALKTLELRARRDAFVVFFLGFFSLLTHFTNSQSLPAAGGALLVLWGLMTALVNAHMPVGRPPLRRAARLSATMLLLGAPLMLALFLFFPRVAPLWGIPADGQTGRSGLSADMEVGQIARLVLDDGIAMRVRFEGAPPPQQALYFRGPVLGHYDGRRWQADGAAAREVTDLKVLGPPLRYEVTMEPSHRPWLLLLDAAEQAPDIVGLSPRRTGELQWVTREPVTDLLRYRAQSHVSFQYGLQTPTLTLQRYVELPGGFNPRTLQWALDLRRAAAAANPNPDSQSAALVAMVMQHLRTEGYRYTLEPGVFGVHAADEFWFDAKAGFCEHIASSFVVLMRALDIPARVVTGYQGGELNPLDGYWVVRQRDAHAWAEVWLPGQGWTRIDPTAAVMPARVGELQRLRAPPGLLAGAVIQLSPDLAAHWRMAWDAINNRWNQWVLNYTQSRQLDLLRHMGFRSPDWTDLGQVLAALLLGASLAGALWAQAGRRRQDPWLRLLEQARRRLADAGLASPRQATPHQLAERVRDHQAEHPGATGFDPGLLPWLLRLEQQRYDPQCPPDLPGLRRDWRRLRWPKRPGAAKPISGLR